MKNAIILTSIIFVVLFVSQNTFAQGGPCLLGVGNCSNTTTSTSTNNTTVDNGQRRVHITDARAREIYQAKQNNQRYLLTLQSYYENGLLCEERAWVGGSTFAGDYNQVVVSVGKTKKVCYNPAKPTYSSQAVNALEKQIDSFTNSYYQWYKYAENMTNYINQNRNNPQAVTYGRNELAKAQYSMTYFQNSITNFRTVINQVAPASN